MHPDPPETAHAGDAGSPETAIAVPGRPDPGLLEAAGWLDDYIFNHRQRLLSALVMMRLDTQPIPALSDTSNNRELVLRDPN